MTINTHHKDLCHYTEYRKSAYCAECRYAECRDAKKGSKTVEIKFLTIKQSFSQNDKLIKWCGAFKKVTKCKKMLKNDLVIAKDNLENDGTQLS